MKPDSAGSWSGGFVSCPQCGQQIPDFAVACPHCGASIATTRSGYCPQCRDVVTVTTDGTCELCGGEAKDVRVEGAVAPAATTTAPPPESPPVNARPVTHPQAADTEGPQSLAGRRRSWLVWVIPLAAVVLAGAGVGIYFGVSGDDDGGATGNTATSTADGSSAGIATTNATATSTWQKLEPTRGSPAARHDHSMAYDANSGRVVLFGGIAEGGMQDTWAYDPVANAWTNLDPTGDVPPVRGEHSMVFTPDTRTVILFGGCAESCFNDTWAYDYATNTWTDLRPAGQVPAARRRPAMVSESVTGRVILFGGSDRDESVYFNDTWAFEPENNTWVNLNPGGDVPPARSGHSMVFDSATGRVILFGGHDTDPYNDTWAYDPVTNTWAILQPGRGAEPPGARLNHAMVFDSASGQVILFGGLNPGLRVNLNDTWAYDPTTNTWTDLKPTGALPSAREAHSMVYDPATGRVILFGGMGPGESNFGDTWFYGH